MQIEQRLVDVLVQRHHCFARCAGCEAEGVVSTQYPPLDSNAPAGWARVHRFEGQGREMPPRIIDVIVCPTCQNRPLAEVLNA